MRITIVGAGPAGLYFAILMKKADPARDIVLFERDGAGNTFGWGIVFSDQTFSYLEESDGPSFKEIVDRCQTWDNVDVVHRGQKISIHGNRFSGIARIAFLDILRRRAAALGVDVRFDTAIGNLTDVPPSDLLVGADGANSQVRQALAERFRPTVTSARNKYVWLGTPRLFHGLTLTFRQTEWGPFAAHSYKFSPSLSTFIVECGADTWRRAAFERMTPEQTCARLEAIFAPDLDGAPLLTNNFVKWLNFLLVRNERWYHDSVVLLGDALHTAHFSIGSGTKLALEDAIALAAAFADKGDTPAALSTFERTRKPIVDRYQEAALESLHWFEHMEEGLALEPIDLAYRLMMRSGRLDHEKLRRRDPVFVEAYEGWKRTR